MLNGVDDTGTAGADLEAIEAEGLTPLHLAAKDGHPKISRVLAEAGANLEAHNFAGYTPLHLAAQQGQSAAMTALVNAGANLNAFTPQDYTPLNLAAQFGHSAVVSALVRAGADPNTCSPVGDTPLAFMVCGLRDKNIGGKDATEDRLNELKGTRRLLLRVEAVHAMSWVFAGRDRSRHVLLWPYDVPPVVDAGEAKRENEITSKSLTVTLPTLRRRARRCGVALAPLFSWVVI